MDASLDEGPEMGRQRTPELRLTLILFGSVAAAMTGWVRVGDDAETEVQITTSLWHPYGTGGVDPQSVAVLNWVGGDRHTGAASRQ